jgi:predicted alpha/beta hydrolase family esterase
MAATLILPGLNGSAEGHWQRHWARDRSSATIVRQASWSRPVLQHWLTALESELERVGEAWLVTHSLGCLLAANRPARWNSELHDVGYAGHINIASGFGRWEQGYRLFSAFTKTVEDQQARQARPQLRDVLCEAMP